jgi:hypothetical protein
MDVSTGNLVICSYCGERFSLNDREKQKAFSYGICSKCRFPIAWYNRQTREQADLKTILLYVDESNRWAGIIRASHEKLSTDKTKLDNQLVKIQAAQVLASSENKNTTIPARQNPNEIQQVMLPHNHSSNNSLNNSSSNNVEQSLQASQYLTGRFTNIDQHLKQIEDKVDLICERLLSPMVESKESHESEVSKAHEFEKIENSKALIAEEIINSNEEDSPNADNVAITLVATVPQYDSEQLKASSSQWLWDYNRQNPDDFSKIYHPQRAGATKETLEVARLAQNGEAIFETGNGNYWMYTPEQKNTGFLMPNRKTLRSNQNIFDSLKICFQLTHSSVEGVSFNARSADFDRMEMVLPAVFDSIGSENEWKMREKGVLSFPLKSE